MKSKISYKKIVSMVMVAMSMAMVSFTFGQSTPYHTKKGYVAHGYDVVSYFDGQPTIGNDEFSAAHDGAKFKFSSSKNLEAFKSNPDKYIPQYGGYCAYAMAINGSKVKIDPETYEIREGKLYLFYNSGKNNTLKKWLAESPNTLRKQADLNWKDE